MTSLPSETASERLIFADFFELGQVESASPFLTPSSRFWARNLPLKASLSGALLLLIAFVLSFFPSLVPLSHLALVFVYFLVGIPPLIESLEDLFSLQINIDVLMTLAAFSSVLIGSGMEGGLLLVLFALAGAMEEAVSAKAKNAISSLHRLSPTKALVVAENGSLREKALGDVQPGMMIMVQAGQVVPLDGTVLKGTSQVNLVHLTGENVPVPKGPGDEVAAGARNMEGALTLRVTRTSSDSTLAKIIELVTQAQESRPLLQRWFDKLSQRYATGIILFAGLYALLLPFFTSVPLLGLEGSLYRALAFLIAASPCALIIAIPIAYLSAIGACAKRGILLKGGIALDALASCKAIAFDKTGTLTTGQLLCLGVEPFGRSFADGERANILEIAYAMERQAFHPIAKAIVSFCDKEGISARKEIANFRVLPGYGVEGSIDDTKVYLGHFQLIAPKLNPEIASLVKKKNEEIKQHGELMTYLLIGEKLFLFRFADEVRVGMKEALRPLREQWHMLLVMLTGDHAANGERVAKELGIDAFFADLRPEDKLRHVTSLSQSHGLAMVGDGINDAPALARATVGVCMGKVGSSTAIDAADIILLNDNIEQLSWLVAKGHLTKKIVAQNISLASLALIGASIPALAGIVPLWLAVILHEGGTVLVGLNALRLLR